MRSSLMGWTAPAVGMLLCAGLAGAAAPSPAMKKPVVTAAAALDAKLDAALAAYDRDLASGKLADGKRRRSVLATAVKPALALCAAVEKAVAAGWPADDPDLAPALAKAREGLAKARQRGFFTCYEPLEAPLKDIATLDKFYETVQGAVDSAAAGDGGKATWALNDVDTRLTALLEADAIKGGTLKDHPAYRRYQDAVGPVRAKVEGASAAAADALRMAEIDFDEIVRRHEHMKKGGGLAILAAHQGHGMPKPITDEERLAQLDALEAELPELDAYLQRFGAAYGTTRSAIDTYEKKLKAAAGATGGAGGAMGRGLPAGPPRVSPQNAYVDLKALVDAYPVIRKGFGAQLLTLIDRRLDLLVKLQIKDTAIESNFKDLERRVKAAVAADPANPEIQKRAAQFEGIRAKTLAAIEARWQSARLLPDVTGYVGPGSLAEIKDQILSFAKTAPQFANFPSHAVSIQSADWRSFSTNALGQTTQWALDILLVVEEPGNKVPGLLLAMECSVLTFEGSGVKKGPPFWGFAIRTTGHYGMMKKNLPR